MRLPWSRSETYMTERTTKQQSPPAPRDPRFDTAPGGSIFRLLSLVVRQWPLIFGVPLVLSVAVIVARLTSARTYTASASFIPQVDQPTQSQLSSLASQFGLDLGGSGSIMQSATFYRTLLESDEIATKIASGEYAVREQGREGTQQLADILQIEESNPARRSQKTVRAVHEMVNIAVDRETFVVNVRVQTEWPSLSLDITRRLLSLVNEFNVEKRHQQAAAEQAFVESRLAEASAQLRQAEDLAQRFLQRNRMFQGDPHLMFEFERLQRQVQMRQAVYTALTQNLERASINMRRNTPMITTIDSPKVSALPDPRGTVLGGILAFVVGFALGVVVAGILEYLRDARQRYPDEYQAFRRVLGERNPLLTRPASAP
jgi:uncharacterized protein involved in exopolysaccharide biosynthesis